MAHKESVPFSNDIQEFTLKNTPAGRARVVLEHSIIVSLFHKKTLFIGHCSFVALGRATCCLVFWNFWPHFLILPVMSASLFRGKNVISHLQKFINEHKRSLSNHRYLSFRNFPSSSLWFFLLFCSIISCYFGDKLFPNYGPQTIPTLNATAKSNQTCLVI